jgi:hypothetical protein
MYRQNTTVPVAAGRVHKHTESFARRIVRTMTSEKTPEETRRKLREALRSLFACTDIDKRRSLSKVENVAAVLGCTGLYYLDREYAEAREARLRLCGVMEADDRQARPWLFPWLRKAERPAARRAKRPAGMSLPRPRRRSGLRLRESDMIGHEEGRVLSGARPSLFGRPRR